MHRMFLRFKLDSSYQNSSSRSLLASITACFSYGDLPELRRCGATRINQDLLGIIDYRIGLI